jgi:hypothetical protein
MTNDNPKKRLVIGCSLCGYENDFDQPYRYHAGFGDQGFLYNEAGNMTLTWSAYDPYFRKLFPKTNTWALTLHQKQQFEKILPPSPKSDRWSFSASARCRQCGSAISKPME